ncbi:A/G-specific adenine glycosylase [Thermaerobacter sp. FW80]|uniref:A/G-specific adenine glycosylase n=1 Tax=Thermaerobacter sp. FW80 TaxID=2546351 RepID=UPI000DB642B0|nr:A/G-specific adenine glycosylase [Thermaerobacter sp. FW80]PZN06582.1 MAG: A/G-specific adenine glycosylase [Bacillota bacterium]QBS36817.1 A/G-specific adenine glycosylase [Thermaerobacter sp. FW80]
MNDAPMRGPDLEAVRSRLIHWYDRHRRDLPWRRTRDPYAVLVSEVMLQQTRVETVLPYYVRFLQRFPSASHLAAASEDEVLRLWQGLGYYRRARQLHQAARVLVERYGGQVPPDPEAVRALPGVGDYTAGAVLSIAFDLPVPAVDGNAQRVLARVFGVDEPADQAAGRRRLHDLARRLVDGPRPGALNQAVMELGATVCRPRRPGCGDCPLAELCVAARTGDPEAWPVRRRSGRWVEEDVAIAWCRVNGRVAVVRRPQEGLLAGLWALPYTRRRDGEGWLEARDRLAAALEAAVGRPLRWRRETLQGRWDFSHRRWHWRLFLADDAGERPDGPAGGPAGGRGRPQGGCGASRPAGRPAAGDPSTAHEPAPPRVPTGSDGAAVAEGLAPWGSAGEGGEPSPSPAPARPLRACAAATAEWAAETITWVRLADLERLAMASLDRRVLAAVAGRGEGGPRGAGAGAAERPD